MLPGSFSSLVAWSCQRVVNDLCKPPKDILESGPREYCY